MRNKENIRESLKNYRIEKKKKDNNRCIDCNKLINKNSIRCSRCFYKELKISKKGKHISPETEFKKGFNKGKTHEEIYGENAVKIRNKINKTRRKNGWFKNLEKTRKKMKGNMNWDNLNSKRTRFKKGHKVHNKGKTKENYEPLRKTSKSLQGYTYEIRYGKEKADEIRKKIGKFHIGEKNHNWTGGNSYKRYPREFNKRFKLTIKQRDGFVCLKCGMREEDHIKLFGKKIHIHHINYDKMITLKENCCILCTRCNMEVNSNKKSWIKFFQSLLSERYGYPYSETGEIILNLQEVQNANYKNKEITKEIHSDRSRKNSCFNE